MDICFATDKLRRCLDCAHSRQRAYGQRAKPLGRLLLDLAAVPNLQNAFLLPGRLEELGEDRKGSFSMRITGNWRLIFEPAHNPVPCKADGGVNCTEVTAIRILDVRDYH